VKQVANIVVAWSLSKQNSTPASPKKRDIHGCAPTPERARRCVFHFTGMLFHFTATVDDTRHRR
jgi:hypothetical protein